MSTDRKLSTQSVVNAIALVHERMDELFRNVRASVPHAIQRELLSGMEAILVEILTQHPVWRVDDDDFMSTAEVAKALFVSRPHVVRLLEQGMLKLHHKTGTNYFVMKASVLDYLADRQAAINAYRASEPDEE